VWEYVKKRGGCFWKKGKFRQGRLSPFVNETEGEDRLQRKRGKVGEIKPNPELASLQQRSPTFKRHGQGTYVGKGIAALFIVFGRGEFPRRTYEPRLVNFSRRRSHEEHCMLSQNQEKGGRSLSSEDTIDQQGIKTWGGKKRVGG